MIGRFRKKNYFCVLIFIKAMTENTFQAFTYPEADGYGQLELRDDEKVILVTNDDGYSALGINSLVESLRGLGRIIVCAPDSPRSGFSSSFTCTRPVSLTRLWLFMPAVVRLSIASSLPCIDSSTLVSLISLYRASITEAMTPSV